MRVTSVKNGHELHVVHAMAPPHKLNNKSNIYHKKQPRADAELLLSQKRLQTTTAAIATPTQQYGT